MRLLTLEAPRSGRILCYDNDKSGPAQFRFANVHESVNDETAASFGDLASRGRSTQEGCGRSDIGRAIARVVEEMLFERGIGVSYETIRRWAIKFGADYALSESRRAAMTYGLSTRSRSEKRYLWRAVDQEGYVLDEIAQIHWNTKAARRLPTRLLRKQRRPPKRIITDKLGSYAAAKRTVMPKVEHRQHKGLNNRAENSHVPVRKWERIVQGFRSWPGLSETISSRLALDAPPSQPTSIA